jgi:hypothetical protein
MTIYRPRMAAQLTVPVLGKRKSAQDTSGDNTALTLPVRVRRAHLTSNDHNHADELSLTVEWADAGTDPRLLSSATVEFYLGNADERGNWSPTKPELRFVGVMTRPQRMARAGEGLSVELEFQDYTAFFLEVREFATAGVPFLDMTLTDAWRIICDYTGTADPSTGQFSSTVSALRNQLKFSDDAKDVVIGTACARRFRHLSRVQVKPRSDAWAVWQQCVGMVGLISYIYLDQCFVTTATDYYAGPGQANGTSTAANPPRLIWGQNIAAMTEARNPLKGGRAIGITSFDPLTGTSLEAIYPPVGDARVFHKRISAKKRGNPTVLRQASDIEWFADPGITDPAALMAKAIRVYEERSRQEIEGTVRTSEMVLDRMDGTKFDLLQLKAGDVARIEFDQETKDTLADLQSENARVQYLIQRGYSPELAAVVAANTESFVRLQPNFLVKKVDTMFETSSEGGEFSIEVQYCNRITVDGDAQKT